MHMRRGMVAVLCIRCWSVVVSAFVQRWRVHVHETVFVILFPLALVTVLSVSDP
jgi:hypothetical protein